MQVGSVITTATTPTSGATSKPTDGRPQVDYLKLIVAQMRNLNPMDPSSGGDGLTVMMQAETLNQLISLNTALRDLQMLNQTSYAAALVGRTVTGVAEGGTVTGVVRGVKRDTGGPRPGPDKGRRRRLVGRAAVEGASAAGQGALGRCTCRTRMEGGGSERCYGRFRRRYPGCAARWRSWTWWRTTSPT